MSIIEDYTVLEFKEKVGSCSPDKWMINSYYETKKRDKQYYKLQLSENKIIRPIATLDKVLLDEAINNNKVFIIGKRKIKKECKNDR